MKKFKTGTKILTVALDDSPSDNPREAFNPITKMWCWHRRYNVGDEKPAAYDINNFADWDEIEEAIWKNEKPVALLSVWGYDHGGLSISTNNPNCRWDSGKIGFIFFPRSELSQLGYKRATKKAIEKAKAWLKADVQEYDDWNNGNVWRLTIEDTSVLDGSRDWCAGSYIGTLNDDPNSGLLNVMFSDNLTKDEFAQLVRVKD